MKSAAVSGVTAGGAAAVDDEAAPGDERARFAFGMTHPEERVNLGTAAAPGAVTGVHLLKREKIASVVPAPSALSLEAVAAAALWTPLPGPCAPRGTPLPAGGHMCPPTLLLEGRRR